MKLFVAFLFTGAAFAASNFTLSGDAATDDQPSGLWTAKVIEDNSDAPPVGFTDGPFDYAVLSLDEDGELNPGFVLRLVENNKWALLQDSLKDTDLVGTYRIDDDTSEFTNVSPGGLSGDADSSGLGTAKLIPQPDGLVAVGFKRDDTHDGFKDAVLSVDEKGYLELGFILQDLDGSGIWALVNNDTIKGTDILGPFTIDQTTGKFSRSYLDSLDWSFCPAGDEEIVIFRTGESVDLGSCLNAHELIATPWTAGNA